MEQPLSGIAVFPSGSPEFAAAAAVLGISESAVFLPDGLAVRYSCRTSTSTTGGIITLVFSIMVFFLPVFVSYLPDPGGPWGKEDLTLTILPGTLICSLLLAGIACEVFFQSRLFLLAGSKLYMRYWLYPLPVRRTVTIAAKDIRCMDIRSRRPRKSPLTMYMLTAVLRNGRKIPLMRSDPDSGRAAWFNRLMTVWLETSKTLPKKKGKHITVQSVAEAATTTKQSRPPS